MFDPKASIEWLSGGLLAPPKTWQKYASKNPDWIHTAVNLAVPLLVVAWIGTVIASVLFLRGFFGGGLFRVLFTLVFGAAALGIGGFIFSFLAGQFGGKHDFNRGFASVTFAAIPGQLGGILAPIPILGSLIALAAAIYGLVLLYQNQPVFLSVPEEKRVVHFAVSLVVVIVVMVVLGALSGGYGMMGFRRF